MQKLYKDTVSVLTLAKSLSDEKKKLAISILFFYEIFSLLGVFLPRYLGQLATLVLSLGVNIPCCEAWCHVKSNIMATQIINGCFC